jgi:hypothetical protein
MDIAQNHQNVTFNSQLSVSISIEALSPSLPAPVDVLSQRRMTVRQYLVLHCGPEDDQFKRLLPEDQSPLLAREEVQEALQLMRELPFLAATWLDLGENVVQLFTFDQEAEAPGAFKLGDQP